MNGLLRPLMAVTMALTMGGTIAGRDVERQALCAPEVAATLQEHGVHLVTYAALQ